MFFVWKDEPLLLLVSCCFADNWKGYKLQAGWPHSKIVQCSGSFLSKVKVPRIQLGPADVLLPSEE